MPRLDHFGGGGFTTEGTEGERTMKGMKKGAWIGVRSEIPG
jgi:hypothetical protein